MWSGYAKTAVARGCCKSLNNITRAVGSRRTSTTSELLEPDSQVLETLVCPFSKVPLTYDREARELLSPVGVAFPITANGIANMMPACARLVATHPDGEEKP